MEPEDPVDEISSKITHGIKFLCLQRLDSVDEPYINDNAEEGSPCQNLHQGFLFLIWTIHVMPSMPIVLSANDVSLSHSGRREYHTI